MCRRMSEVLGSQVTSKKLCLGRSATSSGSSHASAPDIAPAFLASWPSKIGVKMVARDRNYLYLLEAERSTSLGVASGRPTVT